MGRPRKRPVREETRRRTTTLTFRAQDLSALARFVSAGMVMLQTGHPVVSRLKAAMTRLGLPVPRGL
jgi:hypothetical protein